MILFVVLGNITCSEILDDKYTPELLLFPFDIFLIEAIFFLRVQTKLIDFH